MRAWAEAILFFIFVLFFVFIQAIGAKAEALWAGALIIWGLFFASNKQHKSFLKSFSHEGRYKTMNYLTFLMYFLLGPALSALYFFRGEALHFSRWAVGAVLALCWAGAIEFGARLLLPSFFARQAKKPRFLFWYRMAYTALTASAGLFIFSSFYIDWEKLF